MAARYVRIGQHPDYRDEIRGTLSEILASTANPGTYAAPEDVTGTFLEMGSDGLWTGASVGYLTKAQADAVLVAQGVQATLKVGVPAHVDGGPVTWRGAGSGGWGDVVPGIRPVSGFVLIGDSHLALATGGGAVSQTAYYCMSPASWITWLQILTGHAIPAIANLAVGGTRCDRIALTVDAALSYKPAFIVDSSYTNDNIQQYDYSRSIAVKNEYYNKIISAGVTLVVYIAPPFTGMNATQRSNFRKHVQWCYDYAAANKNVIIADGASFFIDPASSTLAPFSSYMTDAHHATPTASRAFAVSLLNQQEVKALFPKTRIPFLGANDVASVASETPQLFDNPGFSGSASTAGAGVTGVAPTYWNVTRNSGSGTVACSLVANSFGGQDFETTFANCVSGDTFQRQIVPSAGFLTAIKGKSIYFRYEREYTGVSGVCEDYMQAYVDGNENFGGVNYTTGASARLTDNTDKTETVTIGPFLIPANASIVRFNFKAIFGASGGGKIAMRNMRVYDSAVMGNTRV